MSDVDVCDRLVTIIPVTLKHSSQFPVVEAHEDVPVLWITANCDVSCIYRYGQLWQIVYEIVKISISTLHVFVPKSTSSHSETRICVIFHLYFLGPPSRSTTTCIKGVQDGMLLRAKNFKTSFVRMWPPITLITLISSAIHTYSALGTAKPPTPHALLTHDGTGCSTVLNRHVRCYDLLYKPGLWRIIKKIPSFVTNHFHRRPILWWRPQIQSTVQFNPNDEKKFAQNKKHSW